MEWEVAAEDPARLGTESGRPDSNRRRPAWEAGILPLNYARGTGSCPAAIAVSTALLCPRRLEKAAQIRLAHRRLAWRDIVQPPLPHPPLELAHELEEM